MHPIDETKILMYDTTKMNTYNIFPHLEEKFADYTIEIVINNELDSVFTVLPETGIIEVQRLFQLLDHAIQEFIVWQLIYSIQSRETDPEKNEAMLNADRQAFEKIVLEYGNTYESILFLSMKILLPEHSLKGARLTNLYYQLSNRNQ